MSSSIGSCRKGIRRSTLAPIAISCKTSSSHIYQNQLLFQYMKSIYAKGKSNKLSLRNLYCFFPFTALKMNFHHYQSNYSIFVISSCMSNLSVCKINNLPVKLTIYFLHSCWIFLRFSGAQFKIRSYHRFDYQVEILNMSFS